MKLIVGLGNPGEKYKNTRHNVGFMVLDKIQSIDLNGFSMLPYRLENQFKSYITQTGGVGEKRIIFAKPETYMNLSGETVKKIKDYYKIEDEDITVICDDLNLDLGTVRVRSNGSDGGHNGLKSIIEMIGNNFWRVRIGIGNNRNILNSEEQNVDIKKQINKVSIPAEKYVLGSFTASEKEIIAKTVDKVAQSILESISQGLKDETIKISF